MADSTWHVRLGATNRTALAARANSTAYIVGDKVKPATGVFWLECTTAGTTDVAAPTFTPVYGNTVTDGTVVWTYRGTGVTAVDDDAWHVDDTLSTTNINAIAARDLILFQGGTYSPAGAISMNTTLGVGFLSAARYLPADDSGAVDITKEAILDGQSLTVSSTVIAVNITVQNSAGSGWNSSNAMDGSVFINCKGKDNATDGFTFTTAGLGGIFLIYCEASGNGAIGFNTPFRYASGTSVACPVLYRCVAKDNTSYDLTGNVTNGFAAAFGMEVINSTTLAADKSYINSAELALFVDGLIRNTQAQNNTYAQVGFLSATANNSTILLNSIIAGLNNAGTGAGVIDATLATGHPFMGGNISYDNKTSGYNNTPDVNFDDGPNTTNPAFTSTTDHSPTADLSGIALFKPVDGVSTGDDVVGPIPEAGGAGGGLKQIFGGVK